MEGRDEGDSNVLTSEESVPVEDTCGIPTRGKQDGDVPENKTCVSGVSTSDEAQTQESVEEVAIEQECVFSVEEKKLWETVQETPSDFSSWTQLLQAVEQKGELPKVKKVFNGFFKLFPYCYGFWKKYADLVHRLSGPQSAIEVFEQGVAAIPLSVDLWLHYIKFTSTTAREKEDFVATLRSLYNRAVTNCGLDFRSDKLWLSFIEWEKSNSSSVTTPSSPNTTSTTTASTPPTPTAGRLQHVLAIYDQLLATPTQQHQQHFESFMTIAGSVTPQELLSAEDYERLSSEVESSSEPTAEETGLEVQLQQRVMENRRAIWQHTTTEVNKRRHFEDAIKRPYFHVKPLERSQLKNWQEYLNFEIEGGDIRRILTLFERCMIACAMYEDFWMKFAKFTEEHYTPEYTRSVYSRACQVHLRRKPMIHLAWAAYEEQQGNVDVARGILSAINSSAPGHALIQLRRVGLEVRHHEHQKADALFIDLISNAQSNEARAFYSWRYARFLAHVCGNMDKAVGVLQSAVEKEPGNLTLHLQLVNLVMSRSPLKEEEVEEVFEKAVTCEDLTESDRHKLTAHRLQFMEEFSTDIAKVVKVFNEHKAGKRLHGRKRSAGDTNNADASKKTKQDNGQIASHAPPTSSSLSGVASTTQASADTTLTATTPVPGWGSYQQPWGMYPQYGQQGYSYQQWSGYQYPAYTPPHHQ